MSTINATIVTRTAALEPGTFSTHNGALNPASPFTVTVSTSGNRYGYAYRIQLPSGSGTIQRIAVTATIAVRSGEGAGTSVWAYTGNQLPTSVSSTFAGRSVGTVYFPFFDPPIPYSGPVEVEIYNSATSFNPFNLTPTPGSTITVFVIGEANGTHNGSNGEIQIRDIQFPIDSTISTNTLALTATGPSAASINVPTTFTVTRSGGDLTQSLALTNASTGFTFPAASFAANQTSIQIQATASTTGNKTFQVSNGGTSSNAVTTVVTSMVLTAFASDVISGQPILLEITSKPAGTTQVQFTANGQGFIVGSFTVWRTADLYRAVSSGSVEALVITAKALDSGSAVLAESSTVISISSAGLTSEEMQQLDDIQTDLAAINTLLLSVRDGVNNNSSALNTANSGIGAIPDAVDTKLTQSKGVGPYTTPASQVSSRGVRG